MNLRNCLMNASLALLIVLATFLPTWANVAAAESAPLQNGTYELPFQVLKDGTNEPSVMDGYTKKPAKLYVKDGTYSVDLTLTNSNWYEDFTVEGERPETISENSEANERVVRFPVSDLDEKLNAWVHIIVTGIPGFNYDSKYDVQFDFDSSGVEVIELEESESEEPEVEEPETEDPETENPETEQPETEEPGTENPETEQPETEEPGTENPETEQPETETPETEQPVLEEGSYTVPFAAKHATEDRDSSMSRYLVNPADLAVKADKQTLSLTIKDSHQITSLQLEEGGEYVEGTVTAEDEEENTRTYAFDFEELKSEINAKVSMRVALPNGNVYENTQDFRLFMDLEGALQVEEPEIVQPEPEQPVLEEGSYTVPFAAKHSTEDRDSSMSRYLVNPADLTVEEDKQTFSLTVKESHQITSLQLEEDGEYVEGTVTAEDAEENTRTYAFTVDQLNEAINAKVAMRVALPNGSVYENTQDFRVVIDLEALSQLKNLKNRKPNSQNLKNQEPKHQNLNNQKQKT
ncbi:NEAT domain-containing protein [Bacillus sp. JCM 19041]|uniref:NEAT domain-containing protein n=1 Tax=Bacillus sp. JCM 19041 TaxID=1460637 RepID=UPI0006CFB629